MYRTSAKFIDYDEIQIEVTIKASKREWSKMLALLAGHLEWPITDFRSTISEVLRSLDSKVDKVTSIDKAQEPSN